MMPDAQYGTVWHLYYFLGRSAGFGRPSRDFPPSLGFWEGGSPTVIFRAAGRAGGLCAGA